MSRYRLSHGGLAPLPVREIEWGGLSAATDVLSTGR